MRAAWEREQQLAVHGWVYGLRDGLIRDLGVTVGGGDQVNAVYQSALAVLS